ncbi:MAG: hypothetical protein AAF914_12395, partial [Pseudomonadota bacterium]
LVEVEIDYRREGIGGDMPELPVEFKLTLTRPKTAIAHGETRIEAYALPAAEAQLLIDDRGDLVRAKAHRAAAALRAGATAEVYLPGQGDDAGHGVEHAPEAGPGLDYLDRLVVTTTPPAAFRFGQPRVGRVAAEASGTLVLALGATGRLYEDTGRLQGMLSQTSGGKIDDTAFVQQMKAGGRYVDPRDLGHASELAAFFYSDVVLGIKDRFGAAAAQLLPHTMQEFRETPNVLHLLAAAPRMEHPTELTREFARGLGMLDEQAKAGHLARALLRDDVAHDRGAPRNARLTLWADDRLAAGRGWDIVPVALHGRVRAGVAAGLDFNAADLGAVIDYLSRPNTAQLVDEMGDLADRLTKLGVLRQSLEAQFVDLSGIAERVEMLREISDDLARFAETAERHLALGQAGGYQALPLIDEIAAFADAEMRPARHRIVQVFADWLRDLGFDSVAPAEFVHPEQASQCLARFFFDRIAPEVEMIDGIVRCGYADPLPAAEERVVPLAARSGAPRGVPGLAGGDGAPGYHVPLDQQQLAWLYAEGDGAPGLIAQWRRTLRDSYEEANR